MDIHGRGLQFSYIATYIHGKGGGTSNCCFIHGRDEDPLWLTLVVGLRVIVELGVWESL